MTCLWPFCVCDPVACKVETPAPPEPLGNDECQCPSCKREMLTGDMTIRYPLETLPMRIERTTYPFPGYGRSGPFGGPDLVEQFHREMAECGFVPCGKPADAAHELQNTVLDMMDEVHDFGDSVQPKGPAGIAREDEPANETSDYLLQVKVVIDVGDALGGFTLKGRVVPTEPQRVREAIGEKDPTGWPKWPSFFAQKTIITPDAIWRPAPQSEREAHYTDVEGQRCFVTIGSLAHRMGTRNEWQAYVGGLTVGRYDDQESAFAAAVAFAKHKASEKANVASSQNDSGDSPLVSGS